MILNVLLWLGCKNQPTKWKQKVEYFPPKWGGSIKKQNMEILKQITSELYLSYITSLQIATVYHARVSVYIVDVMMSQCNDSLPTRQRVSKDNYDRPNFRAIKQ